MNKIGESINSRMPEDMTQKELADRTGMTPSAISNIINGRHKPRKTSLRRIALVLRCTVDELLEGAGE